MDGKVPAASVESRPMLHKRCRYSKKKQFKTGKKRQQVVTKEEDWQGQEERCVIISIDKHNLKTYYCTPTGLATLRELNNRKGH